MPPEQKKLPQGLSLSDELDGIVTVRMYTYVTIFDIYRMFYDDTK